GPDAALGAWVISLPRGAVPCLGVGDVDCIILVDEYAARPAKLFPLGDEVSVLIEDMDAVVLTVADEQPSSRIEGKRVNAVELAAARPLLPPRLDEFSGLVELHNTRVVCGLIAVSIPDENVAIRSDRDLRWLIEVVR